MTGPSSTPQGEHTPRPGATWEQHLIRAETVIPDDAPDPRPNRKTRRAQARRTEDEVTIPKISIAPPTGATVLAARHLDQTEGPAQVGTVIDQGTRSAITTVLRYIATAHNAPAATPSETIGKQGPTAGEAGWAEQERARFERLYIREFSRADKAEQRIRELESSARDASFQRGIVDVHKQAVINALERAEAAETERDGWRMAAEDRGAAIQRLTDALQQTEAANTRVRALAARIRQGVPWTANDDDIAAHIVAALDGQAPGESCSPAATETEPNNPRTTVNNPATSSDPHIYLSTGCWHGDHAYCQNMTGLNGAKRPASCKKCGARCICPCHQQAEPPTHIGGQANAEDCPACAGTNPPYPFTCPGPDEAAADDLTGAWTPDPPIGCLTVTAERTPSQRPGLRNDIARAIHRYDHEHALSGNDLPSKHHRGEADAVLKLLCQEWPWLRAEAEDAASDPAGHREQLHAAIESEVYEYRERTMWWPETGGVTTEIARLATRGAMEVRDAELETVRATLAAITAEAARRGVISIDGIRTIVKEQQ